MTDIVITHTNLLMNDRRQREKMKPFPPLGTLYCAAIAEEEGLSCCFYDSAFADSLEPFRAILQEHKPRVLLIVEDYFHFVPKMCLISMRETCLAMTRIATAKGITVIVGGPDATDNPEIFLDAGVLCVIQREVEATLKDLLRALDDNSLRTLASVKGIAFREAGDVKVTDARMPLDRLDELPFPAWHLFDFSMYEKVWKERHELYSLNMVTSRGCPYDCSWCAKPIWGQTYSQHSPRRVVDEIRFLRALTTFDNIWFADDIFGMSEGWIHEFAQCLIDTREQISYMIQCRADLITKEFAEHLSLSGCSMVWLGVESGSQDVLDRMNKQIDLADIYAAGDNLQNLGIDVGLFLQFGYPGEQDDDILKTVQMMRTIDPKEIGISVSYPLPGTIFHRQVEAELGSRRNWAQSDDLATFHHSLHDDGFYKKLREILYREVEWKHRLGEDSVVVDEINAQWQALYATKAAPFMIPCPGSEQIRRVSSESRKDA